MGGTVKGRVDCVVGSVADGNRNFFVNIKQFFDALVVAGYGTLHATQYGAGANGFDFHDGVNPAGENAFFVFKWATSTERPGGGSELGAVYTLVQWADGTSFGTAPGNPGLLKGSTGDGIGIQTAFLEDGGDPWTGLHNADGADTKGAVPGVGPVWTAGGSTLHILDYSSTPADGTYDTDFQNLLSPGFDTTGNVANRIQLLADEDSFLVLFDAGDNGSYTMHFTGLYIPKPGVTASYPMICISDSALPLESTSLVYGTAGGNSAYEGGMVTADVMGPKVGALRFDEVRWQQSYTLLQPNPQSPTNYDEFDIIPFNYDTLKAFFGWPGSPDLIRQIFNAATHEANAGLTRAAFGSATVNTRKITTPWGSASPPGTGSVRSGRSF